MTKEPDNTGRKQDGKFRQGQSGNPAGKPVGTRHKATQAALMLLDGETEALTRKAVDLALEGDTTALKMCLDRIVPSLKSTAPTVKLNVPMPESLTDAAKAFISAAANGEIPPDIAAQMVSALAGASRVEEMESVKQRLEGLERAIKEQIK